MQQTTPKFEVNHFVRDKHTGRVMRITDVQWQDGWCYSFDMLGWRLYPEEDLEPIAPMRG